MKFCFSVCNIGAFLQTALLLTAYEGVSQMSVCSHFEGGYPIQPTKGGEYPIPGLGRGVPHLREGGTLSQVQARGVPHPADMGIPYQV